MSGAGRSDGDVYVCLFGRWRGWGGVVVAMNVIMIMMTVIVIVVVVVVVVVVRMILSSRRGSRIKSCWRTGIALTAFFRPTLTPLHHALNLIHQRRRPPAQVPQHPARVRKAADPLEIVDGILLHVRVGGALPQDVGQQLAGRVGVDGVDDGEGELAFGEVFAGGALGQRLRGRRVQVLVVVLDLEEEADGVDERDAVALALIRC